MTIIEHIDVIERLILESAKPESVSTIRGQLMVVREQVEALDASNSTLKNELTVTKNLTEHEVSALKEENAKVISELTRVKKAYSDFVAAQSAKGAQVIDNTTPDQNATLWREDG